MPLRSPRPESAASSDGLQMQSTRRRGFTILELLVVIAVIGALSAIIVPSYLRYRLRAQDSAARSEAANFYTSAMGHFAEHGLTTVFSETALPDHFSRNTDIVYLGAITIDPQGTAGGVMVFRHSNGPNWYWVFGRTGLLNGTRLLDDSVSGG